MIRAKPFGAAMDMYSSSSDCMARYKAGEFGVTTTSAAKLTYQQCLARTPRVLNPAVPVAATATSSRDIASIGRLVPVTPLDTVPGQENTPYIDNTPYVDPITGQTIDPATGQPVTDMVTSIKNWMSANQTTVGVVGLALAGLLVWKLIK